MTWSLVYDRFDPKLEGLREALCTLGNGYFATRGAAPESSAGDVHYPGTYMAGLYNRMVTEVSGRDVENEDLVNLPNWLPLSFRVENGPWFDPGAAELLDFRQELDLRRGVLQRRLRFRDEAGRETSVSQRRLVSMADPHLAALETSFAAENWSGTIEVRSGLDGGVTNAGVPRYRELRGDHLLTPSTSIVDEETVFLETETRGSHVRIAEAACTRVVGGDEPLERTTIDEDGFVGHVLRLRLEEGRTATVEKVVALATSRDHAIYEPGHQVRTRIGRAGGFPELLDRHALAWSRIWSRFDLSFDGDERAQMILRLHVFHLLQTVSPNTIGLDAGVPARGWHGEAYRGHIFWDELFILPFLDLHLAVLSRSLLMYRYRRLAEARHGAREEGLRGAMYPWQSGSDGREETQVVHLNPKSGRWVPDNSHRQRHINIAIAYNVWRYWQITGDLSFLRFYGAEMLVEIARFWASIATHDDEIGRYRIRGVMGPDEYHDGYPDAEEPAGIDDNAYTNVMVSWVLRRALEVFEVLPAYHQEEVRRNLGVAAAEISRWDEISRKLYIPFHDGVISQFEGYGDLKEFDWDGYREKHGDIQRLDRILEAEGDDTNRYKLSKQADVLMLFFLLSDEEVDDLLRGLGYDFDPETDVVKNVEYYLQRTSHGSTLSRVVHAWILARLDRTRSWELFLEALESDVGDIQGGTTAEGIHLGAMAGTVDLVQRCYAGIAIHSNVLWMNPALPDKLLSLAFQIHYRGHRLAVEIDHQRIVVESLPGPAGPIEVGLNGRVKQLTPGHTIEAALHPPGKPAGRRVKDIWRSTRRRRRERAGG